MAEGEGVEPSGATNPHKIKAFHVPKARKSAFGADTLVTLSKSAAESAQARIWGAFLGYKNTCGRLPGPARPLPR